MLTGTNKFLDRSGPEVKYSKCVVFYVTHSRGNCWYNYKSDKSPGFTINSCINCMRNTIPRNIHLAKQMKSK